MIRNGGDRFDGDEINRDDDVNNDDVNDDDDDDDQMMMMMMTTTKRTTIKCVKDVQPIKLTLNTLTATTSLPFRVFKVPL